MRSLVLAVLAVVPSTLVLSMPAAADCAAITKALTGIVTDLTCLESTDLTTRNDATTPPAERVHAAHRRAGSVAGCAVPHGDRPEPHVPRSSDHRRDGRRCECALAPAAARRRELEPQTGGRRARRIP